MDWRHVARDQAGVISRPQLRAAGVSRDQADHLVAVAGLSVLTRGVYLVGGAPRTYRSRLWAALLATRGALGYATAGELWGVIEERSTTIHVVVPHDRHVTAPHGVRLHRWRPEDVPIVKQDGLALTARSWTVLTLIGSLPDHRSQTLADRAVQQGWITAAAVDERLRRFPGRHGNTRLRRIATVLGDGAAAESERRLHRILRSAGIGGWRPNYAVWIDGDLVAVVDVALLELKIAIEVDGMAHHIDPDRFQRDRTRQNRLIALGWTVLRFTWTDLTERPGYVIATIRRLAA
ncbi:MAG: hypothetical protein QOG80_151 [Pseudonocardiales bacterium]|jgi:very-short-patch-repair endonuclease|nr:hypothetical protein [Pseudonocardiales bacterium]